MPLPTTIVCTAVAECPALSVTVMVSVCEPLSFAEGVHQNPPDELMVELETDEPEKESLIEKTGFVKLVGTA